MKKLYIIFSVIGLVVVGGYLVLRYTLEKSLKKGSPPAAEAVISKPSASSALDIRPLFIAKLQQMIQEGSSGLYQLQLDSMDVDILQSRITLRNVKLNPDFKTLAQLDKARQAPNDVFRLTLNYLYLDGINLDDVITRKTIDVNTIRISAPLIEVYRQKRTYNKAKEEDTTTLYQRIMTYVESIAVKKIVMEKGTLISRQLLKNKQTKVSNIHLVLSNILIDSSTQKDRTRFLFAKGAEFSCSNYQVKTKDGLYLFKANQLSIKPLNNAMTATGVYLLPLLSKQEFKERIPYQKERYQIEFPKISIRNIRWWDFLNEEELIADGININKGMLYVYLDRSLPLGKPRIGSYPHQLLMKLPIPVHIKSLNIKDLDMTYEEFSPVSGKSGVVQLSNIKGQAKNITNMKQQIKQNRWTIMTATSSFLNIIPIHSTFHFDLNKYKTGHFSAKINVDGFNATLLNPVSEPLGLFSIKKGVVNGVTATMNGNNKEGRGKVLLLYKDLKLSILEKDESKQSGVDTKRFMSLLANTLIIKDNNPSEKEEAPRYPEGVFQRKPEGSFFNLVWKTMLVGVLESVGAKAKLAEPKQQ